MRSRRFVFTSNDFSDQSIVNIIHDWNSKTLVGLSKILGRQDAPCIYAFLDDCTFPYLYDFRAGNSTVPEIVADRGRVGVRPRMSEGK